MRYKMTAELEHTLVEIYPEFLIATDAINKAFGFTIEDLRGDGKNGDLYTSRLLFCALCPEAPVARLAAYLNRDHSSIIHGKNLIMDRMVLDPEFRKLHRLVSNYYNEIKNVEVKEFNHER